MHESNIHEKLKSINMEISKEQIEKIHKVLNRVSPVDYDCGKLCGEICCLYDDEDYSNDDLLIYLLPGEELLYENSESFEKGLGLYKTVSGTVRDINPVTETLRINETLVSFEDIGEITEDSESER